MFGLVHWCKLKEQSSIRRSYGKERASRDRGAVIKEIEEQRDYSLD